jgi:hypothetical protein
MSTLHQMAPLFFLVQFLVLFGALVVATRLGDRLAAVPESSSKTNRQDL